MAQSALRYRLLDLALERGVLPDCVLRAGSRWGAVSRLRREERGGVEAQDARLRALVAHLSSGDVAEVPERANEQHYELPAEFLGLMLGPRRKYSGCYWPEGVTTLAEAEGAMLRLTCERAGVRDGMDVLDLGCGWGALSLWLAEQYPHARILGVSNSRGQREHIMGEAARRGLENLEIRTADVNAFDPGRRFDRVMSVEMFEHMRNWKELLRRVSTWLKDEDARVFTHVFSHRHVGYRFEGTWAAERFFTAGVMPSHDLLSFFQHDLEIEARWAVSGTHYAKTLRAWLPNLDANADAAREVLRSAYGAKAARRLLGTWRMFYLCTEEIWGLHGGDAWLVSHHLLKPRAVG